MLIILLFLKQIYLPIFLSMDGLFNKDLLTLVDLFEKEIVKKLKILIDLFFSRAAVWMGGNTKRERYLLH